MSLEAVIEVFRVRAQYFRDINDQGVEMAREMAFLFDQCHDPVF